MIATHKIKLYPTKGQEIYFRKACGVARFAYNWALNRWKERYKNGEKSSAYILIKELTAIKRQKYPWMMDVTKSAPQYAIHNLEKAFKNFFKKQSKYPRFKKKGIKDSFVAVENNNKFKYKHKKIWIPKIGWVRCAENLRFDGKVYNVVIKRTADMWFAVVTIKTPNEAPPVSENQVTVGVDLGVKHMMILSNGEKIDNLKPLNKRLRQLKRQQRKLSRRQKSSNNKRKQRIKVARLHYKINNIRQNAIHDATKYLVDNFDRIVIEDLNNAGMVKNHNLARQLNDVSFGEIRRQLAYKAYWYGKEVVIANRYFASTKICSSCGYKNTEITLSTREWTCPKCLIHHDRDVNSAKNLAKYGSTSEVEESNACGEDRLHDHKGRVVFDETRTNC
ncbi:RNA-guided endonuclease TnpB family protein [Methanohalobium sp.]|uniref:RNA-guided endonuclease InsQ/TnpB family protein n=1 Tax=Methanohalobium sp. TaxID=2837493 RepID=UPI0025E64732|nr:RNA-guided endonuclease TnpB family protein [Methanohalobium sp.]